MDLENKWNKCVMDRNSNKTDFYMIYLSSGILLYS
jgi:hypothetical protein